MRTDYESTTSVEMIGPEGSYREVILKIGLRCTSPSYPGSFNPMVGGEPPYGPEFDTTYITFLDEDGKQVFLSEGVADQLFGKEIIDQIMEAVNIEATERGNF